MTLSSHLKAIVLFKTILLIQMYFTKMVTFGQNIDKAFVLLIPLKNILLQIVLHPQHNFLAVCMHQAHFNSHSSFSSLMHYINLRVQLIS